MKYKIKASLFICYQLGEYLPDFCFFLLLPRFGLSGKSHMAWRTHFYPVLMQIWDFLKSWVVRQPLRKLKRKISDVRHQVPFYLWWIETVLKLCKITNIMNKIAGVTIFCLAWYSFMQNFIEKEKFTFWTLLFMAMKLKSCFKKYYSYFLPKVLHINCVVLLPHRRATL